MSVDTNFYIGVYLVVDQFIEEIERKRVCEKGHAYQGGTFCSQCGTKFTNKKFPRTKRMTCWDAAEEFDFSEDAFTNVDRDDDPHIWIGNKTNSLVDADDGQHATEINPDTIAAAVGEFRDNYATELALLDKNGVEYEMLYGAVIYYS